MNSQPAKMNMQDLPASWSDAKAREVTRRYNTHGELLAALVSAVVWAEENKQRAGTLDVSAMRAAITKAQS